MEISGAQNRLVQPGAVHQSNGRYGLQSRSVMLRNNFYNPNYGALEFNWSFPMSRGVKWFVHYFNGYGESLIDYNARVNRLGFGIAFTDWL